MISFGGKTIYHLGDTAPVLGPGAVDASKPIDVALMCIGGHYTMDRHDAVEAARLVGAKQVIPCHYDTFPPIETDAQAFKSEVEAAGAGAGRRARARGEAHPMTMTHAVVLIEAERDALSTLGGELADIEGVAEAYSVTGRVGLRGDRARASPRAAGRGGHRARSERLPGVARTQTMVAFAAFSRHDLEALFSIGED